MTFGSLRSTGLLATVFAGIAGVTGCSSPDDGSLGQSSDALRQECAPRPTDGSEPRWMRRILSRDHRVKHVSTVAANFGETVELAVRERVKPRVLFRSHWGHKPAKVVLFMHGASISSVPDFDLRHSDYNWMSYLAADGMDTFAMDVTGYGLSPRPKMDDPCNAPAASQLASLMPAPLSAPCAPSYPFVLSSGLNEYDEIDTVVDYLRKIRHVDKISLVGWSQGAQRLASYTSRHPEKVESLFLYAPQYNRTWPATNPLPWPIAGTPMTIQTKSELMNLRWGATVKCPGQIEPGVQDAVWSSILTQDPVGASWGEGVMRVRTWYNAGWNQAQATQIQVPTFIIVGEDDANLTGGQQLYADLPSTKKVLVTVPCATHFMLWEKQHNLLPWTSRRWVANHNVEGVDNGIYRVNQEGIIDGIGGPANDCVKDDGDDDDDRDFDDHDHDGARCIHGKH